MADAGLCPRRVFLEQKVNPAKQGPNKIATVKIRKSGYVGARIVANRRPGLISNFSGTGITQHAILRHTLAEDCMSHKRRAKTSFSLGRFLPPFACSIRSREAQDPNRDFKNTLILYLNS